MDLANLLGGRTGCCTGNRKKWAEWATVASAAHFAVSCVTSCPATQYCDHMLHPIHGAERKTEREHYPCLLSSPFSLAFPAAAIAAVGAMRRPTSTSVARRSFVRSFVRIPTTSPDDVYYLAKAAAAAAATATATFVGRTKLLAALTWQTFSSPLLPSTRRRRRRNSRAHFLLHWETLQATCLGAGRTHGQAPLLRSFVRLLVWQRCRPLPMPDPQSAGRPITNGRRRTDSFGLGVPTGRRRRRRKYANPCVASLPHVRVRHVVHAICWTGQRIPRS